MAKKEDKTLPIIGLLLNIFILPGLGTTINKKYTHGIIQMSIYVLGFIFVFTGLILMVLSLALTGLVLMMLSFPLFLAAWIWALVDGIILVSK